LDLYGEQKEWFDLVVHQENSAAVAAGPALEVGLSVTLL
jgi:hypothetical protein